MILGIGEYFVDSNVIFGDNTFDDREKTFLLFWKQKGEHTLKEVILLDIVEGEETDEIRGLLFSIFCNIY